MSNPDIYTVGWICAVTTEFVAARAFLNEKHDPLQDQDPQDDNNYALGRIGKHNVVMAVLPKSEYGTTSAATVARDMLRTFPNIRFGLMVGIGGGAPSAKHDIRLGDVVVSTRGSGKGGVFQYDYGKTIQDRRFVTTGSLNQPPQVLLTAVSALEAEYELEGCQLSRLVDEALSQRPQLRRKYCRPPPDSDRLYRSDVVHPDSSKDCGEVCGDDPTQLVDWIQRSEPNDEPCIHYGLIASANQLMKDALIRDSLAADHDVLCFEMEAAGLMNHFPCIVIRGICDYSDSHKNKEWQGFAAIVAAAYAKDLLCQISQRKIEAETPIKKALDSIETAGNITKETVISMAYDHNIAKIERWLSPPEYSTNANLAREQCHPGTGTWLLNSPIFNEWESGSRLHLWFYGLAGCGKSILSTTILDHLLSSDDGRITLAFFFDFNDTGKQKLDNLLRSLAAQLYRTSGQAARKLDTLFASLNEGCRQPDTTALSMCLVSMIEMTGQVRIIIDALDECVARQELLRWLKHLISNTSKVQLIVTGRPEAEFEREIPRLFDEKNCVLLDKEAINADIRSYVEAELTQRPDFVDKNLSPSILEMVRDKIGNGADGMFRWAACQLDSLAQCLSPRDVKIALESLPRTLNETYRRMLANIPAEHKRSSVQLLQFLVHTKRPLTVSEAIEVIATQVDQEPRGFNIDGRLYQQKDILRYCPNMVVIAKVSKPDKWTRKEEVIEELHLAHFSVKEYLLEEAQFDLECASIILTKTCLAYLRDIEGDYNTLPDEFPMARYAAEYWIEYAPSAEGSEDALQSMVSFLRDDTMFQRWTHIFQADWNLPGPPGPPKSTNLYYACLSRLSAAAIELLLDGVDINAKGGELGTALLAASHRGKAEVVKLLLDRGADVNVQFGNYGSALQAASHRGDLEIAKLLLDRGADVSVEGGYYGDALLAASVNGNPEVITLLLDKAADVNSLAGERAECGNKGNALQAASCDGNLEAVKVLLDRGADVDKVGGSHGTALIASTYSGNLEIVKLLLDRGADVNLYSGSYTLQHALLNGNLDIVRLLFDRGADVNAQGGIYGNALLGASICGPLEAVQMLLDRGADVDAHDSDHGYAIQAASYSGNLGIVKLLLDSGADVNAEGGTLYDEDGSTLYSINSLQEASKRGHLEIVSTA